MLEAHDKQHKHSMARQDRAGSIHSKQRKSNCGETETVVSLTKSSCNAIDDKSNTYAYMRDTVEET